MTSASHPIEYNRCTERHAFIVDFNCLVDCCVFNSSNPIPVDRDVAFLRVVVVVATI